MHREDKKANLPCTHLWVLSPASRRLHGVRSLDNLLRRGGGLVRGVVWTLLHHVLTLLALWRGRARAFTQDWWAGGRALVWVTGSAKKNQRNKQKKERKRREFIPMWFTLTTNIKTNCSAWQHWPTGQCGQQHSTYTVCSALHHLRLNRLEAPCANMANNGQANTGTQKQQQQQKQQWRNEMA